MQHRSRILFAALLALVLALPATALAEYHGSGSGTSGSGSAPAASAPAATAPAKGVFRVGDAKVTLAGREVELEVPPHIFRDNALWVPVRAVAEAWGARLAWDGEKRQVHVFGPKGEHFFFTVGESKVTLLAGGGKPELSGPTHIVKDRAQIPLAFLAEHFGYKLAYDEATKTATVTE